MSEPNGQHPGRPGNEIPDPLTDSPTPAETLVPADVAAPAEDDAAPLTKAPVRPKYAPPAGPRPPGSAIAVEKSLDFGPSLKRLLGHLVPERVVIIFSIVLAVAGIVLSVIGPKILGWATDVIFTGFIGRQLPAGATKEQAVAALRAEGNNTFADLVQRLDVTPGVGIDFSLLSQILLIALGLYVVSSLLLWWQGYLLNAAVQRSIYRMRNEVQTKINRLPLSYFDRSPRGELLSRVTNDIDNISQALQQTLSQLFTSLLTVIGVVIMMFVVSPLLALIALVTIPISVLVTGVIGKRAQKQFVAQWRTTGELNGHVEEAFTGQSLVKVFGRRAEVEEVFRQRNEGMYSSSFAAQFISGMIMPTMMFIGNLNYVIIAVVGGLRVASGTMNLGRRAGVHPVHPDVHPAPHPGGLDGQPAAVRRGFGGAGLRGAGRPRARAGRRPAR